VSSTVTKDRRRLLALVAALLGISAWGVASAVMRGRRNP
jgi:hypothetical protein